MELEKVASVLEAAADYLDALDGEKQAAVKAERERLITIIGEKYAEATGEDISDDVLRKLADADTDLLSAFEKFAETSFEKTAELGEPSDKRDFTAPVSKKEAAEAADERFLDFLVS